MEREQASKFMHDLLRLMKSRRGSDLFLTADFPPAFKVDGQLVPVSSVPLTGACAPMPKAITGILSRRSTSAVLLQFICAWT